MKTFIVGIIVIALISYILNKTAKEKIK